MPISYDDLAGLVQKGEQNAFIELASYFEGVIRAVVSTCDVDNEEKEDLYQEGLLGLYKAALTYKASMSASFPTFARICIKHSIISALRIYYSKKNYPIRSSLSLDSDGGSDEDIQGLGPISDPEAALIEQEDYRSLLNVIDVSLSELERKVLYLFIQGMSYGEISLRLQISTKSVGNAIQRIRGKLKLFIQP